MDPAFILAPAPAAGMTTSAPLNLMPFSLGPASAPYASTSAPISQYFQPRPCPGNIPGVSPGMPFASFRGRQLVGQEIAVPRGYKGVVLSSSARPEMGFEHRQAAEAGPSSATKHSGRTRQPMTPASSTASIAAAAAAATSGDADELDGVRRSPRKSARVRGAGQVALSKPKKREAPRRMEARKRIRLDSDDEDEGGAGGSSIQRTDREVTPVSTSNAQLQTPVKEVPVIQIQGPTPRKEPTSTPRRSLRRGDRAADFVPPGAVPEDDTKSAADMEPDATGQSVEPDNGQGSGLKADDEAIDENDAVPPTLVRSDSSMIIPSPATEDDPPAFDVVLKPEPTVPSASSGETPHVKPGQKPAEEEKATAYEGPVRVLRPTSTFSSFMLWTADAPLAGFRQEGPEAADSKDDIKVSNAAGESEQPAQSAAGDENAEAKVRQGWWQQGGGGEGGDEVVRALGEWLGLVETIHKPLYLDDPDDSDDETE